MYTVVYIYRVPVDRIDAFVAIQTAAAAVYLEHGAVDDETLAAHNLEPLYGCLGFGDVVDCSADERLYFGLARFRDRPHHDQVMALVDNDARIDDLYEQVCQVIDINRVVRGEFERIF